MHRLRLSVAVNGPRPSACGGIEEFRSPAHSLCDAEWLRSLPSLVLAITGAVRAPMCGGKRTDGLFNEGGTMREGRHSLCWSQLVPAVLVGIAALSLGGAARAAESGN